MNILVLILCCVPCDHGMVCPWVVGGDSLHIWRAAVTILNKLSQTDDMGWWSSSLGIGQGANYSPACYKMLDRALEI